MIFQVLAWYFRCKHDILGVSVIFNQILGSRLTVPTCCALAHSESETRLTGSTAHMMIYLMQASYLEVTWGLHPRVAIVSCPSSPWEALELNILFFHEHRPVCGLGTITLAHAPFSSFCNRKDTLCVHFHHFYCMAKLSLDVALHLSEIPSGFCKKGTVDSCTGLLLQPGGKWFKLKTNLESTCSKLGEI